MADQHDFVPSRVNDAARPNSNGEQVAGPNEIREASETDVSDLSEPSPVAEASTHIHPWDNRVRGESKGDQTNVVAWTVGQVDAAILLASSLPKGQVVGIDHQAEGICEKLKLKLKGGKSITVDSAERRKGQRTMHPNLRYRVATSLSRVFHLHRRHDACPNWASLPL